MELGPGTFAAGAVGKPEAGNTAGEEQPEPGLPFAERIGNGVEQPDIVEAARIPVRRIEGQPAVGADSTVDEEPASGQGQPRACCNVRPSSRCWDPHGIGHHPLLLVPMAE